ncbi:DUF1176 domain-containing protein [Paraburkholderia sp. BL18I3N2]|uniref:DUF1176 domain-containing protein n=1 Tax=Paraburkholderia sp. BL18I3N2 TaxID=1938799 RepID=UPI000D083B58
MGGILTRRRARPPTPPPDAGDCGASTDWAWDGKSFRALKQSAMPRCRSVPSNDWPVTYAAMSRSQR